MCGKVIDTVVHYYIYKKNLEKTIVTALIII